VNRLTKGHKRGDIARNLPSGDGAEFRSFSKGRRAGHPSPMKQRSVRPSRTRRLLA
jgi:hypothetical protein